MTPEQEIKILRIDNLLKASQIAELVSNNQEYGRVERAILLDKLNAQINALANRDWVKQNLRLDNDRSQLRSKVYTLEDKIEALNKNYENLLLEVNELRAHWAVKLLKKLGVMK